MRWNELSELVEQFGEFISMQLVLAKLHLINFRVTRFKRDKIIKVKPQGCDKKEPIETPYT